MDTQKKRVWAKDTIALTAVIVLILAGGVLIEGCKDKVSDNHAIKKHEAKSHKEILHWTCGMHPGVKIDEAGKCPVCSMDLVPVYREGEAPEKGEKVSLTLSEEARNLSGIETVPLKRRRLIKEIYAVGKVDYDESKIAYVSAWTGGRIDRLYADFTGVQVKKGDHLVLMYSPRLVSAQDEYLIALKSGNRTLINATRKKLLLLGITKEQIGTVKKMGKAKTHLTVYAPIGGTVIHKTAMEGMYVKEGDPIYQIADFKSLWVLIDIFEYEIGWVKLGQKVEITIQSYPGEIFSGEVAFINPFLDEKTRTLKVRINVGNRDLRLKPGMYANARIKSPLSDFGLPIDRSLYGKYICPMHPYVVREKRGVCPQCGMDLEKHELPRERKVAMEKQVIYVCPMEEDKDVISDQPGDCPRCGMKLIPKEIEGKDDRVLAVPKLAILDTGRRKLVYVEKEPGKYVAREVQLGPEAMATVNGSNAILFPVLSGLAEGERVVTRGNFLIDSQTRLTGAVEEVYGGAIGKDEETMPPGHRH